MHGCTQEAERSSCCCCRRQSQGGGTSSARRGLQAWWVRLAHALVLAAPRCVVGGWDVCRPADPDERRGSAAGDGRGQVRRRGAARAVPGGSRLARKGRGPGLLQRCHGESARRPSLAVPVGTSLRWCGATGALVTTDVCIAGRGLCCHPLVRLECERKDDSPSALDGCGCQPEAQICALPTATVVLCSVEMLRQHRISRARCRHRVTLHCTTPVWTGIRMSRACLLKRAQTSMLSTTRISPRQTQPQILSRDDSADLIRSTHRRSSICSRMPGSTPRTTVARQIRHRRRRSEERRRATSFRHGMGGFKLTCVECHQCKMGHCVCEAQRACVRA